MISENTHVAFDAELCAANPEAAADKIAELEHALACAGGMDRTRVIVIEDLRKRLSVLDRRISARERRIARLMLAFEDARRQGLKLPGDLEPPVVLADGACVRCGAAPRNASGLCATCVYEDAVRAGEVADDAAQALWRQALEQERVESSND